MLHDGVDPSSDVEFGAKSWLQINEGREGSGASAVMSSESKAGGFHLTSVNWNG
jgi:hypothetical protein